MRWKYTRANPCQTCYGWNQNFSSSCTHEKFVCPECGRQQCLLHWPYPMKTEEEAIHFLRSAQLRTGKRCFIRQVKIGKFKKWKIFASEEDYDTYIETRKHKRQHALSLVLSTKNFNKSSNFLFIYLFWEFDQKFFSCAKGLVFFTMQNRRFEFNSCLLQTS